MNWEFQRFETNFLIVWRGNLKRWYPAGFSTEFCRHFFWCFAKRDCDQLIVMWVKRVCVTGRKREWSNLIEGASDECVPAGGKEVVQVAANTPLPQYRCTVSMDYGYWHPIIGNTAHVHNQRVRELDRIINVHVLHRFDLSSVRINHMSWRRPYPTILLKMQCDELWTRFETL